MKKITKNDLKGDVIIIPQPNLLIESYEVIGYNAGLYGHNWRAYQITDDIIGLVGNRNFPARAYSLDYDISISYDQLIGELSFGDYEGREAIKEMMTDDIINVIKGEL